MEKEDVNCPPLIGQLSALCTELRGEIQDYLGESSSHCEFFSFPSAYNPYIFSEGILSLMYIVFQCGSAANAAG